MAEQVRVLIFRPVANRSPDTHGVALTASAKVSQAHFLTSGVSACTSPAHSLVPSLSAQWPSHHCSPLRRPVPRPLPSGQKITVIDYFESESQFFDASPADATLTGVGGSQTLGDNYLAAVDVDDDGYGYAIGNTDGEESIRRCTLPTPTRASLSGELLIVLNFGDVQAEAEYCTALDYTSGVLDGDLLRHGFGVGRGLLGHPRPRRRDQRSVADPALSVRQPGVRGVRVDGSGPEDRHRLRATAYPDGPALFTLSQDAGATFVTYMDRPAYGFDFDSSGQAWVTTWLTVPGEDPYEASALATLDLTDGSNPFAEVTTEAGQDFEEPFIQPVTVWGADALPATGPADASLLVAGAAGLLLLGSLLAAVTMLRRRNVEV